MHIAFYSPSWPPAGAANGIVTYVATVREYLLQRGLNVSVLSEGRLHLSDGRNLPLSPQAEELSRIEHLKRRAFRRVDSIHGGLPCIGRLVAAQLQAAHRIAPIDIIDMEESFGWSDTVRRLTKVPVVTRLHGPYFLKPAKPRTVQEIRSDRQRCHTEGRAVRSSVAVTAPTRAIMNITCEHYQRPLRPLDAVIPNPIQLAPEPMRWKLDECDPDHILMIGRFDFWKGADVMLLAFDKLVQTRPSMHLTLVGPELGIETSPGQTADFQTFAREKMSPEGARRVTLTGTLPPAEIAQLRKRAFVTVVASRVETYSYALVEGLAAGCPMISADWLGSDEIIQDGETGFLSALGDPDALAEVLSWLCEHPEIAAEAAAKGFAHCARTFTVDTVGTRLLECYEATIRNSGQ